MDGRPSASNNKEAMNQCMLPSVLIMKKIASQFITLLLKMENKAVYFARESSSFLDELRTRVDDYFNRKGISRYGNAEVIAGAAFMAALYLGPYIMMLSGRVQSPFMIFLCWVIMGFGMAGVGMVLMHDANHGSFSPNRQVNRWLGKSLYLLGGFPPNWRQQHNSLHHGYTNIDGVDEDIRPPGILRISPHRKWLKIHRFQYIYAWLLYGLMTLSWITIKDFKQLNRYRKNGVVLTQKNNYNRMMADLIATKVLYYILFLVVPLFVLPIAWYLTVLFFLVMHLVCGMILGTIFQTAHVVPATKFPLPDDQGDLQSSWARHQLAVTSDFAPRTRLLSWLIGGLNYQVEHHLFPYISHVHYRKIAPLVRETAQKYHLPYHVQPTFWAAISAHLKMLKILGREPSEKR
jgi:linoleoyl-CoA desaturase